MDKFNNSPAAGVLLIGWFMVTGVAAIIIPFAAIRLALAPPAIHTETNIRIDDRDIYETTQKTDCGWLSFSCTGGRQ